MLPLYSQDTAAIKFSLEQEIPCINKARENVFNKHLIKIQVYKKG